MARLQSMDAASAGEEAASLVAASQASVFTAELEHSGLGEALAAQKVAGRSSAIAREEGAQLAVVAPATGVVATEDPENLLNRDVNLGEPLLTIVDPMHLVARLYVPVSEIDRVRVGDPVALQLPFQFFEIRGRIGTMEGSAVPLPAGLMENQGYKGTALPAFYTTRIPVEGAQLRPGVSGEARVFGARRSLASRVEIVFANMLRTHFW
jgi:hypothetical protein